MDNKVGARPDHYATLEVAPSASSDEIVQAFSSQMRSARVRPDISVIRLAQLSVAYETLRDPEKRRAYDDSLGLNAKPAIAPPIAGATLLERLNRVADVKPNFELPARPKVVTQGDAESRVAAFIAASVREPVKRPEPQPPTHFSPPPASSPPAESEARPRAPVTEEAPAIERRRPSIGRREATLGAGAAGFAIVALALAVPQAANPDRIAARAAQPQAALTIPLPAVAADQEVAVARPAATTPPAPPSSQAPHAVPAPTEGTAAPTPLDDQLAAEPLSAQPAEPPAVDSPSTQAAADTASVPAADAAPADTAQVTAAKARLPLPGATIARTIQRIGYGCGSVISTSAVEGADGVFKVTCSSGDSYRAAPVGGRYHFRRWVSH